MSNKRISFHGDDVTIEAGGRRWLVRDQEGLEKYARIYMDMFRAES